MKVILSDNGIFYLNNKQLVAYLKATEIPYFSYWLLQDRHGVQPAIWKKVENESAFDKLPPLAGKVGKYYPPSRVFISSIDCGEEISVIPARALFEVNSDILRIDETLIDLIESSPDDWENFHIVEIPDDIDWYIDELPIEYVSTREIVREKHRIFD